VVLGILLKNCPAVLIVVPIVLLAPLSPADIAEFMATLAGHVVAAFVSLNHHPAQSTSLEVQGLQHELKLVLVAISLVLATQTLGAEFAPALTADQSVLMLLRHFIDGALAVFRRAKNFVGIFKGGIEGMDLSVLFLDGQG
jgi:type III secretory pathway component EscS